MLESLRRFNCLSWDTKNTQLILLADEKHRKLTAVRELNGNLLHGRGLNGIVIFKISADLIAELLAHRELVCSYCVTDPKASCVSDPKHLKDFVISRILCSLYPRPARIIIVLADNVQAAVDRKYVSSQGLAASSASERTRVYVVDGRTMLDERNLDLRGVITSLCRNVSWVTVERESINKSVAGVLDELEAEVGRTIMLIPARCTEIGDLFLSKDRVLLEYNHIDGLKTALRYYLQLLDGGVSNLLGARDELACFDASPVSLVAHPGPARTPGSLSLPSTPVESKVSQIVRQVFDMPIIGIDDDLRQLGADSIMVVQALSSIAEYYRSGVPVHFLLEKRFTIRRLSEWINMRSEGQGYKRAAPELE